MFFTGRLRLIDIPPGVDVLAFMRFDGKMPSGNAADTKAVALGVVRDHFLATRESGREKSTQYTSRIHFKHLAETLGEAFPPGDLSQADLRRHIERRARMGVAAVTIRKEITTLRTAWQWGVDGGLPSGGYPNIRVGLPERG